MNLIAKTSGVLLLLSSLARANILELSDFRLSPFVLAKKQDFTYSSGFATDENSAIRFDLALHPMNTEPSQLYALMIITADLDASAQLVQRLTNGTAQASP